MIDGSPPVTSSPITALPPSIPAYLPPTLASKSIHVLFALEKRVNSQEGLQAEQSHLQGDDDHFLEPLSYGHNYQSILTSMSNDMRLLHAVVCELVTEKLKDDYLTQSPPHPLITRAFKNEVSPTAEILQKVVVEVMERGKRTFFFD